jgi:hypothetical protein
MPGQVKCDGHKRDATEHGSLLSTIHDLLSPISSTNEAIRLSWCHLMPTVDWEAVAGRIIALR